MSFATWPIDGIIESFGFEQTFKGHWSTHPAFVGDIFNKSRFFRDLSNLTLNVSRGGAATIYLDNLCQCFTILIVKYLFLIQVCALLV